MNRASSTAGRAVLAALLVLPVALLASRARPVHGVEPHAGIPSSIVDRYLSRRPSLGPVTVVDVASESADRKLLAATLQGVVNRTVARIYLVGARASDQDQHWLDDYVSRGLVTVAAHDTLDQALAAFASEVKGYVIASDAEPWTINTATTVAAAEGGVVATADEVPALQALGLTEIADHRGRWADAATAYDAIAAAYRSKLAYPGLAIEGPGQTQARDFFVQQGIMTVYTRPSQPDYSQVYHLLDGYPTDHPVYGYVSDTGVEEVQAIVKLAQAGRFLVPTDTTDNLSFHIAVGASLPRTRVRPASGAVAPCTSDTVNVVIAMSDGDNMVIPEAYYASGDRWGSPNRGQLPLGWGLSPVSAILMPSIWDRYAATATDNDEVVGIMGLGYAVPSLMPDGTDFLTQSALLDDAVGVSTHWSLDALLSQPAAGGWTKVHDAAAASGVTPQGILLNYEDFGGPPWFRTADGVPVLASQQASYDTGPSGLAAHLSALLATPPSDRPLVTFLPATVWTSTYDSLLAAVGPFAGHGVRFLTPRDAFACLPGAPTTTTTSSTSTTTSSTTSTTTPPTTTTTGTRATTSSPATTSAGVAADVTDAPDPSAPATAVTAVPTYTG